MRYQFTRTEQKTPGHSKVHRSLHNCGSALRRTKHVYQFTRTEQKAPDDNKVHSSLQNCGCAVRNWLYVTLLASGICVGGIKIFGPLGMESVKFFLFVAIAMCF